MRYPIFALTTISTLVAIAPEQAYAGDPEADKRIYEAFEKYIKTVPNEKKEPEYKKFLEWYPTNIYAPTIKKELEAFVADQATTTPPPPQNNNNTSVVNPSEQAGAEGGYGISTNKDPNGLGNTPFGIDPMAEAAGAVDGGAETDAAAALDGVVIASDPDRPLPAPTNDFVPISNNLRRPQSFGLGADFALSAFVGVGLLVDYTTLNSRWTVGGALRAPVFQTVQLAFEARRFLTPEKPISFYLGGSVGSVSGDIGAVLDLVQRDFQGTNASSAFSLGAMVGAQQMRPDNQALYAEISYQYLVSELNDQAVFPGLSVGYRYFFK